MSFYLYFTFIIVLCRDESIAGSIDLREAVKISMNTKSGKDDFGRFDIDTEDR